MTKIKPLIKPFHETAVVAARVFSMDEDEAYVELLQRMRGLGLSILDVEVYVNFASHNALTMNEIAQAMQISKKQVSARLRRVRRLFPHLFLWGPNPNNEMRLCQCSVDENWIEREAQRLERENSNNYY